MGFEPTSKVLKTFSYHKFVGSLRRGQFPVQVLQTSFKPPKFIPTSYIIAASFCLSSHFYNFVFPAHPLLLVDQEKLYIHNTLFFPFVKWLVEFFLTHLTITLEDTLRSQEVHFFSKELRPIPAVSYQTAKVIAIPSLMPVLTGSGHARPGVRLRCRA